MSVVHLWAIGIGAAAVAAPVVIHWLTRPRPVRMPLSTLRFVREAIHQRRARHLLRDLLILGLRTLAVAMLALAVARPLFGPRPLAADRQSGDTVRIVLVDVSQSMGATVGATQQIAQARTLAANQYLQYESGLWANLILAGATPRTVFEGPSTNFETLRDELSRCQALPERFDVKAALERAAQMLAPTSEQDQRRRELVIFSDFQRSSWAKADFSAVPAETVIKLESTAPKGPDGSHGQDAHATARLPNLAVLRAAAHADSARAGSVRVEVEVGNFTLARRKMTVDVTLGEAHRRLEGSCEAKGRSTLSADLELSGSGWQWGQAELVDVGTDDALAADNVRPLVVQLRPKPTYALLTRQPARTAGTPGRGRRPSSSYFLECALVPDGQLGPKASATVVRLDPANFDAKALAAVDLVCLDHPGKLSDDAIKVLSASLRRGRPVFYVAGETIDATNLKRLAQAGSTGLQMPVEFTPPPAGANRRNLFLKDVRSAEPPFSVFGDSLSSFLGSARFAGGLTSRRLAGGLADDVLATYNDGSACLVSTVSDAGALVVLNADLAGSELPGKSMFVLLVQSLVDRIMNRSGGPAPAFCGERLAAQLPPEVLSAGGLRIVGPESYSSRSAVMSESPSRRSVMSTAGEPSGGRYGELVEEGAGVMWNWRAPDRPGVYRVCRDPGPGVPGAPTTVFAQAIEIPAEESELEYLAPEVIRDRLAAGREIYYRSAAAEEERRDDLWKWFAVACVVCGLGELMGLIGFRT